MSSDDHSAPTVPVALASTIDVQLDVMLARRKMPLRILAAKVGISIQNLSILKTGKARAVRFSTLAAICQALDCQPGDLLVHQPAANDSDD